MSIRDSVHVIYSNAKTKWEVRRSGGARSSGDFDTKGQAHALAKRIAGREGLELVLHDKGSNRITDKNNFGFDPHKTKG